MISRVNFKKTAVSIFALAVFLAVFNFSLNFSLADGGKTAVEIPPGAGLREVSLILYQNNVIRSPFFFEVYNFFRGTRKQLKPGFYELTPNLSYKELTDILVKGPEEISVVIAPGMTLKEIDNLLSQKKIIPAGALENFDIGIFKNNYPFLSQAVSLEGFLLPDTYQFLPRSSPQKVAEKILDNFQEKIYANFRSQTIFSADDFFRRIITASLLEKEVVSSEEQRVAADIINRRLAANMPLQIDASVLYAQCQGRFLNCPSLGQPDLSVNSPFNTYKNKGLPPTPIGNPGPQAIFAAFHPLKNHYWYYLSDLKTKKTIFSKTLGEHLAMINKLAIRRVLP